MAYDDRVNKLLQRAQATSSSENERDTAQRAFWACLKDYGPFDLVVHTRDDAELGGMLELNLDLIRRADELEKENIALRRRIYELEGARSRRGLAVASDAELKKIDHHLREAKHYSTQALWMGKRWEHWQRTTNDEVRSTRRSRLKGFIIETISTTHLSKDTVHRALRRAEKIPHWILEAVNGTSFDNAKFLDQLSYMSSTEEIEAYFNSKARRPRGKADHSPKDEEEAPPASNSTAQCAGSAGPDGSGSSV